MVELDYISLLHNNAYYLWFVLGSPDMSWCSGRLLNHRLQEVSQSAYGNRLNNKQVNFIVGYLPAEFKTRDLCITRPCFLCLSCELWYISMLPSWSGSQNECLSVPNDVKWMAKGQENLSTEFRICLPRWVFNSFTENVQFLPAHELFDRLSNNLSKLPQTWCFNL